MHHLPELQDLETIIESLKGHARTKRLFEVEAADKKFPIYSVTLGSKDPLAPTLGIVAGVHGLERIGSKVVLAFMRTLARLLPWDLAIQQLFERSRMVLIPILNPAGMYLGTRSNAQGVDLMRNAPVDAEQPSNIWIAAGHRISARLPWYRGKKGHPMEAEAKALCEEIRSEVLCSPLAVTMDVHSGYGIVDRIWFPYAKSRKAFDHLAEAYALKELFDDTYPNHVYRIEPQSHQYITHGDLWDYLYDEHRQKCPEKTFIPLTLEMGSWGWVKKNPRQLFSLLGAFNPLVSHRRARTLRRHLTMFDFLHRAVASPRGWALLGKATREEKWTQGNQFWFNRAA